MDEATARYITRYLEELAPLPEVEIRGFLACLSINTYAPGEFFTRCGDTHDRVGFVLRGVFRVYYTSSDGDVHIRNFCKEGMPVGSYATILQGQPAHVSIEALEETTAAQFSYRELEARYDRHAAWERVGRKIAESHYISRERREHHLLAFDAATRYAQFRDDFPGLEGRITKASIASYIGVKPETLSRLMKRGRA